MIEIHNSLLNEKTCEKWNFEHIVMLFSLTGTKKNKEFEYLIHYA